METTPLTTPRPRTPSFRPDQKQRSSIKSQFELTDYTMEEVLKSFNSFDKNGDGSISVDEIGAVISLIQPHFSEGVPTAEEIANMVALVDLNKDGSIQLEEFVALVKPKLETVILQEADSAMQVHSPTFLTVPGGVTKVKKCASDSGISENNVEACNEHLEKFFKVYDRDGDGVITKQEITDVMFQIDIPVTEQEVSEMTKGKNGITFDEFKEIITQPPSLNPSAKGSSLSLQRPNDPLNVPKSTSSAENKSKTSNGCLPACTIM